MHVVLGGKVILHHVTRQGDMASVGVICPGIPFHGPALLLEEAQTVLSGCQYEVTQVQRS